MNKIILPTDPEERKKFPIGTVIKEYFPNAIAAVARRSWEGNNQHHPDKPLHWDMDKSYDEQDALLRHLMEEDWDAVAWRALALCERKMKGGWSPYEQKTEDDLPQEPLSFEQWAEQANWRWSIDWGSWRSQDTGRRASGTHVQEMYEEYVRRFNAGNRDDASDGS